MRNWKNWLAPILTCLTVAALALVPLRLSILRDGELTGAVHTEMLAEDSNFPAKPPELPRRLQLLPSRGSWRTASPSSTRRWRAAPSPRTRSWPGENWRS